MEEKKHKKISLPDDTHLTIIVPSYGMRKGRHLFA